MEIKSTIRNYTVKFESIKDINLCDGDYLIVDSTFKGMIPSDHNRTYVVASELMKDYTSIGTIIDNIIKYGFRKNNRIVAIGGGVVQDISGFIASILYRGVDWVFYPTTLLSQADSCIGGKTSINFGEYKNQIGNFYPPNKIIIDTDFLDTLPKLQIYSGLGEMGHYFFIDGRESFEFFKGQLDNPDYSLLISKSLEIKKKMIELDEFDNGPRRIFNYGHSFGHAIESITKYDIPHGIAVSVGMDISNYFSYMLGYITLDEYLEMKSVLSKIYKVKELPIIKVDDMITSLKKDKKNVRDKLGLILTRGIGDMFLEQVSSDGNSIRFLETYFTDIYV